MRCRKAKFDRVGAMLAIATAKVSSNPKRRESRFYWCGPCAAYHLTSQDRRKYKEK